MHKEIKFIGTRAPTPGHALWSPRNDPNVWTTPAHKWFTRFDEPLFSFGLLDPFRSIQGTYDRARRRFEEPIKRGL